MSENIHRAFFGDAEHQFALTPGMIAELEAKTGSGVGGLFRRMIANDFRHAEIVETIRLGLIGGGMNPETAARLVAAYVPARPLIEAYALAVAILEALMFGGGASPADVAPATDGEAAP
jgi:hypothetical protein